MTLSVVIAHKNRPHLLARSLACWRNQRAAPGLELLVVDDGSDELPSLAAATYDATIVQTARPSADRRNPSVAWDTGLRAAWGEVIACCGAEMMPDRDCARFLYEAPMGIGEEWDLYTHGQPVKSARGLSEFTVCASVPMLALPNVDIDVVDWRSDPRHLETLAGFGEVMTSLWRTNNAIRQTQGYISHSLFSMRRELWQWINYIRHTQDYGTDDVELHHRCVRLGIAHVYAVNTPYVYHQWHAPHAGTSCADLQIPETEDEARLLGMYPDTAGAPRPFKAAHTYAEMYG